MYLSILVIAPFFKQGRQRTQESHMCSTLYYVYLCLLVTSRFCFRRSIIGRKNYTCVQLRIPVENLLRPSLGDRVILRIYLNYLRSMPLRILSHASSSYYRLQPCSLPIQIETSYVILFLWAVKLNHFMRTFEHFTIAVFT